MKIVRYNPSFAPVWDKFVEESKNGTFLFKRGYMDYHSDRFADHSLLFFNEKDQLLAILPANESETVYYSHQGLTYGGFVLSPRLHGKDFLTIFDTALEYLSVNGYKEFYYRQIPSPYHILPSEEENYALWKNSAEWISCSLSSCIRLGENDLFRKKKKAFCERLLREGYQVVEDADIRLFWPVLEANLQRRHHTTPVHTLDEILLLKERFPDNIWCFLATSAEGEVEAGTLLYITPQVVHTQYMTPSEKGRKTDALDFLIYRLIDRFSRHDSRLYFDFGTSMEESGKVLNEGLLAQKESFGGRGIAYNTWKINL